MDNFCAIPGEIKDIIVSFLHDREKRMLRSTSIEWFNKINYSHFTIYFASSSMLPDIIKTFERYSKPIGLCFQKSRELSPIYVTLTTLSNLTRLEIDPDRFASLKFIGLKSSDLIQFSSLTNLQHFSFGVLGNIELSKYPLNLTYLSTRDLKPTERPEHIDYLRNLTNLQTLCFLAVSKLEGEDIFDLLGNPGALKSLEFTGSPVQWQNTESVSKVSNLTKLSIRTKQFMFPFSKLPKLESLNISGVDQLDDFSTSTNLTHLEVVASSSTIDIRNSQQLAALKNLRSLSLSINLDEYDFLTAFTNLESLTVRDGQTHDDLLQYIQSTILTCLKLQYKKIELNHLTHLTNLEDIEGNSFHEPISARLTNVTRLAIFQSFEGEECFPNIKHLEIDDSFGQVKNHFVTSLQHLESLTIYSTSTETQFLLRNMTYLTRLEAFYNDTENFEFHSLGSLIALKVLKLKAQWNARQTKCDGLTQAIAALTNLESLCTFGVADDALLNAICGLSKLTRLRLGDEEADRIDEQRLSRLTNLQRVKLTTQGRPQPYNTYKLNLPYLYDFRR